METLTIRTKTLTAWACMGRTMHVTSGLQIIRANLGYTCPVCGSYVYNATNTPVGREFIKTHVLSPPPPKP